ncbi:MAG: transcriptional regulator [Legionellales bacterium]|nr:transcriptional regulator [Legionellales bacterium]|tara:strand:- start:50118 stop:50399 length:282 start_codon:yes stop_codon:yes gene_type:complete
MAKRIQSLSTPDLTQTLTPELLGQAVRARRTQSNLRLEDTALLCGVAKQTLADIENGKPTTQLDNILKICHGLGIKLQILPWLEPGDDSDGWY